MQIEVNIRITHPPHTYRRKLQIRPHAKAQRQRGFFLRLIPERGTRAFRYRHQRPVAKAHQRRGYAKEAAQAVRDWTFSHTPFGMVYSYMKLENTASAAVARANGMRLLDTFTDAEGAQTAVYGLSRAEWSRQSAGEDAGLTRKPQASR